MLLIMGVVTCALLSGCIATSPKPVVLEVIKKYGDDREYYSISSFENCRWLLQELRRQNFLYHGTCSTGSDT